MANYYHLSGPTLWWSIHSNGLWTVRSKCKCSTSSQIHVFWQEATIHWSLPMLDWWHELGSNGRTSSTTTNDVSRFVAHFFCKSWLLTCFLLFWSGGNMIHPYSYPYLPGHILPPVTSALTSALNPVSRPGLFHPVLYWPYPSPPVSPTTYYSQ